MRVDTYTHSITTAATGTLLYTRQESWAFLLFRLCFCCCCSTWAFASLFCSIWRLAVTAVTRWMAPVCGKGPWQAEIRAWSEEEKMASTEGKHLVNVAPSGSMLMMTPSEVVSHSQRHFAWLPQIGIGKRWTNKCCLHWSQSIFYCLLQ